MLVTYRIESTYNGLRLINLSAKRAGEGSAGNLHAPFDVAGDGKQLTVRLVRHSQRKRGAPDRSDLRSMAPFLDPTTGGNILHANVLYHSWIKAGRMAANFISLPSSRTSDPISRPIRVS